MQVWRVDKACALQPDNRLGFRMVEKRGAEKAILAPLDHFAGGGGPFDTAPKLAVIQLQFLDPARRRNGTVHFCVRVFALVFIVDWQINAAGLKGQDQRRRVLQVKVAPVATRFQTFG